MAPRRAPRARFLAASVRKAREERKRSASLPDLTGKLPLEVGVLLRLFELLKFLEAGVVEPLGVGIKGIVLEESLVNPGKPLLVPQGSAADDVSRRHVLGEVELGSVLERTYRGGVLGVHLQDFYATLSGEGVDLRQQGPIGEAVLFAAEVSAGTIAPSGLPEVFEALRADGDSVLFSNGHDLVGDLPEDEFFVGGSIHLL